MNMPRHMAAKPGQGPGLLDSSCGIIAHLWPICAGTKSIAEKALFNHKLGMMKISRRRDAYAHFGPAAPLIDALNACGRRP
jgi:hypothetical protein